MSLTQMMDFESESGYEESDKSLAITSASTSASSKRPIRSRSRNRFLTKMFNIREMLKWKYNYYEAVPREHRSYYEFLKQTGAYPRSRTFKKLWRLKIDQMFDEETLLANKTLLERELKELNDSQDSGVAIPDPSRLLVNYDREVINMIRRIQDEFSFFKDYPKCYPNYEDEKKSFLAQQCIQCSDQFKDIKMNVDEQFKDFWARRVAYLCDYKIKQEKDTIRKNWKHLLPSYLNERSNTSKDELEVLLISDDEDEGHDEPPSSRDVIIEID